jgi:hypothetical protein
MHLKNDRSISNQPRQPYARLRLSGATIETKSGTKTDIQKIRLSFAGSYNSRVHLTLAGARGTAIELELPRTELWTLTEWLQDIAEHGFPGDWPDSALKRWVAKSPDKLPQAYDRASPALQARWLKIHPELASRRRRR